MIPMSAPEPWVPVDIAPARVMFGSIPILYKSKMMQGTT